MLKKIVGGGYLTNSSPFIIMFWLENEKLSANISFEDAKEVIKTTPIRFAEVVKTIDKNKIVNTFGLVPEKFLDSNLLAEVLVAPSYCNNPYEFSEQFEPKGIGECFFVSVDENENVIDVQAWTKEGMVNLRIRK